MELVCKIQQLEAQQKELETVLIEKAKRLQNLYEDLKIVDASETPQEVLYAKQKSFDF